MQRGLEAVAGGVDAEALVGREQRGDGERDGTPIG
jgi:hypothetical protein